MRSGSPSASSRSSDRATWGCTSTNPQLAFDIMGPEIGAANGKNTRYRGFFLVDRLQLTGFNPSSSEQLPRGGHLPQQNPMIVASRPRRGDWIKDRNAAPKGGRRNEDGGRRTKNRIAISKKMPGRCDTSRQNRRMTRIGVVVSKTIAIIQSSQTIVPRVGGTVIRSGMLCQGWLSHECVVPACEPVHEA